MGAINSDAVDGEPDPEAEEESARDGGEAVRDARNPPASRNPIDVSPALHTAGHEVEDLGFEGLADSAPVLHDDESDDVDFSHRLGADIATRGQDHH